MRVMLLAIFLLTVCVARTEAQQLYKWIDNDGKTTYSDTPPPKDARDVQKKTITDTGPANDDIPYAVKSAMDRNPVVLFANFCGEICDGARALLNSRGVQFRDRNPEKDPGALDALKEVTGGKEVPVLMVGTRIQKGFSEEEWNSALTAGGYPRNNPNLRPRTPALEPPKTPVPVK